MVSSKEVERRDTSEYSLDRIHELAQQGEIHYGFSRVQRHIENLGYNPQDVSDCLCNLESANYRGSVRYENLTSWFDEYLISYAGPTGHIDNLYIKLKLTSDCMVIVLASFHPEGWL